MVMRLQSLAVEHLKDSIRRLPMKKKKLLDDYSKFLEGLTPAEYDENGEACYDFCDFLSEAGVTTEKSDILCSKALNEVRSKKISDRRLH